MFPFPLQITFGNDIGRFDLEVTTFQMAVLFAWNQRPKDRISYESLKLATELPDTELRRTLWVCFNFSLLCITSNSHLIYLSAYMRHSPVLTICSNIYNLSSSLFPTVDVSSGSFSPVFFQSSMGPFVIIYSSFNRGLFYIHLWHYYTCNLAIIKYELNIF